MSHTTKQLLDSFGSFEIEVRGLVPIKGKGDMLTYWLNGEKQADDKDFATLTEITLNDATKRNAPKNSILSKKNSHVRNHSNDSNFTKKSNGDNNNHIKASFFTDKKDKHGIHNNDAEMLQNLMVKWTPES